MNIHLIAAARPNFMKIAPLWHALQTCEEIQVKIVHTGQHYDKNMSDAFFEDLEIPNPHFYLGVGSGSHASQVGHVMIEYEKVLLEDKPDLVVVVGDVNATAACSITAKKHGYKVAHLEAGLRSYDMTMPEEINRKITDAISDYLWTPSVDANENLTREGVDSSKIKLVGNIMIDSLCESMAKIKASNILKKHNINNDYAVVTLHRPNNVDDKMRLTSLVDLINTLSLKIDIYFTVHPRTKKSLKDFNLENSFNENVYLLDPLGYSDFIKLVSESKLVITDSGGIQEEATYLYKPCITIRDNTERPITITEGTNTLTNIENTEFLVNSVLEGKYKKGAVPVYWDGNTAMRIVDEIKKIQLNL